MRTMEFDSERDWCDVWEKGRVDYKGTEFWTEAADLAGGLGVPRGTRS